MGVNGGIRPNARNVALHVRPDPRRRRGTEQLAGDRGLRDQWRLLGAALALGGNVRAGLEDNLYLPDGDMARSTAT